MLCSLANFKKAFTLLELEMTKTDLKRISHYGELPVGYT